MLTIGSTLQNRYELIGTIKAGGMGAIYEVFDRRLGTSYALKEAFVRTGEECALFVAEAQLLARLSHSALPKVIDYFSEHGGVFLVMELVPGDDLETQLHQQGRPFDVARVLDWADQILDVLEYLHQQSPPIIHRDIKPANLKTLSNGRIKLLDFGIARQLEPGSHTVAAAKAYSEEYSPLEQFSATSHTDARSDLYALGATMYHLLTNVAPPSAPLRAHGTPLRGCGQFNSNCPPALTQAILHAMALRPDDRFPDATAFRSVLRNIASPPPLRRRASIKIGVGLGSAALLIGLGVIGVRTIGWPTLVPTNASSPSANTTRPQATPAASVITPLPSPARATASVPAATSGAGETSPTNAPTVLAPATPATPTLTPVQIANLSPLAVASASSMLPEENLPDLGIVRYDASNVLDRDQATSWVEGATGPGIGEQLVLSFSQPINVVRLGLDIGFDRDDSIFAANNRVHRVNLLFSDGSKQSIEFADQRGVQYIQLDRVTTDVIIIIIDSVYAGTKYDDTCIAEVEVWGYESAR